MPKYRVKVYVYTPDSIEVVADNEEEAQDMAADHFGDLGLDFDLGFTEEIN